MIKDFDKWNQKKKEIDDNNVEKIFHEREIWWCSLGLNIGEEQDGKNDNFERPILILRKFNKYLLKVIPLSTKIKEGEFYVNFISNNKEDISYSILLSQERTISSKRLIRKIKRLPGNKFDLVKDKLKDLLKL